MGWKFWKMAIVNKGNKKDFEPNALTIALAEKRAKKDAKKDKDPKFSKLQKAAITKIPYITEN